MYEMSSEVKPEPQPSMIWLREEPSARRPSHTRAQIAEADRSDEMHPHWLADAGEAKSIAAKAAQVVDRSGPV